MLDTTERYYAAFTAGAPFGVALVKRCMNGSVAVGAVFESDWALKPILEQLKPIVEKAPGFGSEELLGLHEDSEDGKSLWHIAYGVIPIGWSPVWLPIASARQALASMLSTQGPKTSKFQIDERAPGGEILAQRIDSKQFGGMVDAVALCCLQIEQHFPEGARRFDSFVQKPWYEDDAE